DRDGAYGLRLRFSLGGVPFERWRERQERLGRFFGPDLAAELDQPAPGQLDLTLAPPVAP
ncbi:MAG: DUF2854 domain-containing protein, partial [Synechococcaceae cyanobacterium]|nr:DUF2854 domain-containing protein [Synechococcaceae cyanobacterium]